MKLVRPSRAQLRAWVYPRFLSWGRARTVFLAMNVVGFGLIGFHGLVNLIVGGASFGYGLMVPVFWLVALYGGHLDWRSRIRLLVAIESGAALPLYIALQWPTILRGTGVFFHFLIIIGPLYWLLCDSGQNERHDPSPRTN